jgi:hypothetical protein
VLVERVEWWRSMLRIRRLEEAVVRLAEDASRPIRGHVHVSIGQEAAAVGACAVLSPGDIAHPAMAGQLRLVTQPVPGRRDGHQLGLDADRSARSGQKLVGAERPRAPFRAAAAGRR